MKKLTTEKARERLAQLDEAAQRCGLSLNEELLQQALQLALAVLDQPDRNEALIKCRDMCRRNDETFPVTAAREAYLMAFNDIKKAAGYE